MGYSVISTAAHLELRISSALGLLSTLTLDLLRPAAPTAASLLLDILFPKQQTGIWHLA